MFCTPSGRWSKPEEEASDEELAQGFGDHLEETRQHLKNVEQAFRRAVEAARLAPPLPRFHDCRHAFASHLLTAGVSAHAVAELMGHSDASLVMKRYGHPMPDELARAGDALSAWRAARLG
jgi:integrase